MAKIHPLDVLAEDLADWIEHISDELVAAMLDGDAAPFAAALSEKQKLAYYDLEFFNPDGTPNLQGRADQMRRLGVDGYVKTMQTVIESRQGAGPVMEVAPNG